MGAITVKNASPIGGVWSADLLGDREKGLVPRAEFLKGREQVGRRGLKRIFATKGVG